MAHIIETDIAIVGGGVAGLWLLNLLRGQGRNCVLLEASELGAGQTMLSQGMIHGGVKYSLAGLLSPATETIAAMPQRWLACLDGKGEVDLSGVRVLSDSQYLFTDARATSKITGFVASRALRGRVEAVGSGDVPEAFQGELFKGSLYRLSDPVLDSASLLRALASRHKEAIHLANITTVLKQEDGRIMLRSNLGVDMVAAHTLILAAGEGNEALAKQLTLPVTMQRRPLHQVVVSGDLPPLYGHGVSLEGADKPRITITTHSRLDDGNVWYLGGELAEAGTALDGSQQIKAARQLLAEFFPWMDFDACKFTTVQVNRAEPGQKQGARPDSPFVARHDNVLVCWPTKLTLAPLMGDQVLRELEGLGEDANAKGVVQSNPKAPELASSVSVASPPWFE